MTPNEIRSPTLYPAELRAHGAKSVAVLAAFGAESANHGRAVAGECNTGAAVCAAIAAGTCPNGAQVAS